MSRFRGRARVDKPPQPSEAQIQQTCTEWLALDDWRYLRTDPVSNRSRGTGFGELGMADCLYIRYKLFGNYAPTNYPGPGMVAAEILWIEWKRQRGGTGKRGLFTRAEKAKIHQKSWHIAERARGALTLIAGENFTASIEGFQTWYQQSGLQRKRIAMNGSK